MLKRGQVTVFIIIALAIVGIAILLYFLVFRDGGLFFGGLGSESNPDDFLDRCVADSVRENLGLIAGNGGSFSLESEPTFLYNGEKVAYLCYTNQYYAQCVVQRPFLRKHLVRELENSLKGEVDNCFVELDRNFRSKGYDVYLEGDGLRVDVLPENVFVTFGNRVLTVSKGGKSSKYDDFRISVSNDIYLLVSVANSILDWEATYGDAEVTAFMNYYKDLKVEKYKHTDGTSVYILTDKKSDTKFRFASRSLAWPPGFNSG